jgi:anhydro-N-acetylmuramic acid kinase
MRNYFFAIGIMSGTSADGVDLALIKTDGLNYFEPVCNYSINYGKKLKADIATLSKNFSSKKSLHYKIIFLENEITSIYIEGIKKLLKKANVKTKDIYIIGAHGQTIFHSAKEHVSLQLVNSSSISNFFNIPVASNFRQNDIQNEGQGAPLVPIFHAVLRKYLDISTSTIFINIGGISNLTYVSNFDSLIAFDTGPGMCLLDQYIYKTKGEKFDPYGKYSYNGTVNKKILKNEISDSFFRKKFPKSLDKNYFDLEKYKNLNFYDACATISMFTAESISLGIKQLGKKFESIIVMGGGSRNLFILDQINKITKKNIYSINDYSLLDDQIEAQAFAFLAVRSAKRLPISFPGTTGVKKSITGGDIFKII